MTAANFGRALDAVLKHEGGFVDHPSDPGGATNKGVTIATFRKWVKKGGTVADLKAITDAQVAKVYRKQYWAKVKGDDLPSGIDYAVFDFAVNSGPTRAAKYLQAVLGVAQDGVIGPQTIAAARAANAASVVNTLCDKRMAFLKSLRHWPTFGRGWTSRVAGVRSLALDLTAHPAPQPQKPSPAPNAPPDGPRPSAGIKSAIIATFIALLLAGLFLIFR